MRGSNLTKMVPRGFSKAIKLQIISPIGNLDRSGLFLDFSKIQRSQIRPPTVGMFISSPVLGLVNSTLYNLDLAPSMSRLSPNYRRIQTKSPSLAPLLIAWTSFSRYPVFLPPSGIPHILGFWPTLLHKSSLQELTYIPRENLIVGKYLYTLAVFLILLTSSRRALSLEMQFLSYLYYAIYFN